MFSVRSETTFWAWAVAWEPMVNHLPELVRQVTHHFSCTSSWRDVRQFLVWKLHYHSSCVTNKLCWVAETQKIWQFCHFPWPLSVAVSFLSLCHLWLLGTENKPFFSFCCQVINWCSGEDGRKEALSGSEKHQMCFFELRRGIN